MIDPGALDRPWLKKILEDSFFSDPRRFRQDYDFEPSPVSTMLGDSPVLDYVRQLLPEKVSDTPVGRWIDRKAADLDTDTIRGGAVEAIRNMPLGGFSQSELGQREQLRDSDELVRMNTVQAGMVPTPDGLSEVPVGDSLRAGATQAAGVALGDMASDGLRNIWWFLNAPQAIASLAVLQALHGPAQQEAELLERKLAADMGEFDKITTPFGSRRMRLAATMPAVIAASIAVGNAGRQAGYTAAVPSEADRKVAADPLAELGARYFLGRTGSLLPYDEFVKERPDVSKGEFEAYKAYLHGSAMPIKATLDGIHGPEVTFMGKSVPVLTGLIPAAAAIYGARRGMGKAIDRLKADSGGDRLLAAEAARLKYREAERTARREDAEEEMGPDPRGQVEKLKQEFTELQKKNEIEMLKHTLFGSAAYLTPAALGGQTLELIRRGMPDTRSYPELEVPEEELLKQTNVV